MKATFLGTGTSVGIPVIGCDCGVCVSPDPRDRRRRASLYVQAADTHLLIDTSPDFREQALALQLKRVDGVLFTHSHADHIFGFDDIRRFNTIQGSVIPAYASAETMADLRRIFNYVRDYEPVEGVFRPRIEFREVHGPFEIGGIRVEPLPVLHADKATIGYRLSAAGKAVGYVPDCHEMPDETLRQLRGVDVMILDALRHRPHRTHLHLAESLRLLAAIGAGRSFVTHMCHDLGHEETQRAMPEGMAVPHDGLAVEW